MPALGEILALPAPPLGGLKDATPSTIDLPEDRENGDKVEKVKPAMVATHTRTIGMIHPPPDIRSIVDKTAEFVSRNGPEFEKRILTTNKGNAKFNFLIPTDPYHAYYRHKVGEFRAQRNAPPQAPQAVLGTAASGEEAPGTGPSGTVQKEDADADKGAAEPKGPVKNLEPPEAEQYTVRMPEGITGLDLDIIKLTAQFVARNGKSFLTGLTSREHLNPQFHFLKPTHSLFTLFTALADAYSKVLMPPKGLTDRLGRDAHDRTAVLQRCLARLEWERSQRAARQRAEDEVEAERLAMAQIDWHDFVVVETIEFGGEEEEAELPQPVTLDTVISRSKLIGDAEEEEEDGKPSAVTTAGAKAGREGEVEMDAEEVAMMEEGMRAATISEQVKDNGHADGEDNQGEMDMEEDEDEEAPIRVVKNYPRPEERAAASAASGPSGGAAGGLVVSPITGELVPVAAMAEHMRVSLIDPKYREQKERMLAKLRETTLAGDDEISRNIMGLARTRPDIFGTTEEEVSNAVKAELEKKQEEPKHVVWDGHAGSIGRTALQATQQGHMSLEEQISVIQREKAQQAAADGRTLPGPASLAPLPTPLRPLPPPPGLAVNMPKGPAGVPALNPTPGPRPGLPSMAPPPPMRPPTQAPRSLPPPPAPMRPPPAPMQRPSFMPPPLAPPPQGMQGPSGLQHSAPRPQFMPPPQRPPPSFAPPPPPGMGAPPSFRQAMPPPPPPQEAPPPPPEEPDSKRQRLDEVVLVPEDQFLAQHPGPVRITVTLPSVEGEEKLQGQAMDATIGTLAEATSALKERVAAQLGMPANKLRLSGRAGFFKDGLSLAHYNVGPGDVLSLQLKERGGRKK